MSSYSIQIDRNLAEEAQSVLQSMGSDITSAVTAFLRRTVRKGQADPYLFTERKWRKSHGRFINRQIAQRKLRILEKKCLSTFSYRGKIAFTTASNLQNFVQNHNDETNVAEIHRRGMEEIRAGKGIRVSMETFRENGE